MLPFLLLLHFFGFSHKPSVSFEAEVTKSCQFLKSKQNLIQTISRPYGHENALVMSIVAPELIRYHLFSDFFETGALETLYVGFGKNAADFSIGYFQMKPSFVEKLEDALRNDPMLIERYQPLVNYSSDSETLIRSERIQRLKSLDWQIRYAHAYYDIALRTFANITFENKEEQRSFIATAYNYGFDKPAAEIARWSTIPAFPYGLKYGGKQQPYEKLAATFYTKLSFLN